MERGRGWKHMKKRNQPAQMMRVLSEDAGLCEQELLRASRFLKTQKRLPRQGPVKTGKVAEKNY